MTTDDIRREFLDRREAAEYITAKGLRMPVGTLQRYAHRRRRKERGERETGEIGPPYAIWSIRAVYRKADLDAWVTSKLAQPTPV